jgi:hypothetical protein
MSWYSHDLKGNEKQTVQMAEGAFCSYPPFSLGKLKLTFFLLYIVL